TSDIAELGLLSAATVSPDETYAAFGFDDGNIEIWNIDTELMAANLRGHAGAVTALDFSPDNRYLLSGGSDKAIRLWSVPDGKPIRIWSSNASNTNALKFSADGRAFVAGSADGTARLWSIAAQPEWPALAALSGSVTGGVAFSPDSRQLAAG